jgi:hypothetical protein
MKKEQSKEAETQEDTASKNNEPTPQEPQEEMDGPISVMVHKLEELYETEETKEEADARKDANM